MLCLLVKALQTTAFCSFWRKCQIWSSCMASTHDTWKGDESEATRLSVYLESWRRYKPVQVCWSVWSVRMISCSWDVQYLWWERERQRQTTRHIMYLLEADTPTWKVDPDLKFLIFDLISGCRDIPSRAGGSHMELHASGSYTRKVPQPQWGFSHSCWEQTDHPHNCKDPDPTSSRYVGTSLQHWLFLLLAPH